MFYSVNIFQVETSVAVAEVPEVTGVAWVEVANSPGRVTLGGSWGWPRELVLGKDGALWHPE